VREIGEKVRELQPRIRRIMEAVVSAASLAPAGRCGHRFSVEDVVAGHGTMYSGKGVGIEIVTGKMEELIAGVWLVAELAEFVGSSDEVKDGQIGVGACGVSDVRESGGNRRVYVGTSE
jgi:hypothetical protein